MIEVWGRTLVTVQCVVSGGGSTLIDDRVSEFGCQTPRPFNSDIGAVSLRTCGSSGLTRHCQQTLHHPSWNMAAVSWIGRLVMPG